MSEKRISLKDIKQPLKDTRSEKEKAKGRKKLSAKLEGKSTFLEDIISRKSPEFKKKKAAEACPNRDDILSAIMNQMNLQTTEVSEYHGVEKKTKKLVQPAAVAMYRTTSHTLTDNQKTKVENLLKVTSEKMEVEASFGTFKTTQKGKIFLPGVRSTFGFNQIKSHFDLLSKKSHVAMEMSQDVVDIIEGLHTRRITDSDGNVVYQKKFRKNADNIDVVDLGLRFSKSSEIFEGGDEFEEKWAEVVRQQHEYSHNPKQLYIQRKRDRISYTGNSKKYRDIRVDLTFVEERRIFSGGEVKINFKNEVEIEAERKKIPVDKFLSVIEEVMLHSQGGVCEEQIMDMKEKALSVKLHNNLFHADMTVRRWQPRDPMLLFAGYWNKPVNLKLNYILDPKFDCYATVKLDGRRMSLLIHKNGVYLVSPPYDIIRVGNGNDTLSGTLIDCEYMESYEKGKVKYTIYGFDILFHKNSDVRSQSFIRRLETLREITKTWNTELYCGITYKTKEYFEKGDFYERTSSAFAAAKKYPRDQRDGLIFQPVYDKYNNTHTYKWKSEKDMTIDFYIKKMTEQEVEQEILNVKEDYGTESGFEWIDEFASGNHQNQTFWLLVGQKGGGMVPFVGTKERSYPGFVVVDDVVFHDQSIEDKIIECKFDENEYKFTFYRYRDDRTRPNNLDTAVSVWRDILNPLPKDTIKGNTLQLMRKYHNKYKFNLLRENFGEGSKIVDIGSGRGGDLMKWNSLNFNSVIAVEPNKDNRKELERRKSDMVMTTDVVVFNKGAENTGKIKELIAKMGDIDGITAFFSLTFFPQEEHLYKNLLKTISLIPVGGKFVGAVMDGQKVFDLIEKTRDKFNLDEDAPVDFYSNEEDETKSAFVIRQISELDKNPYKNEIEVDIRDSASLIKPEGQGQTEWLFYFDFFKKQLEKQGFVMLVSGFIDEGSDYEKLSSQAQEFSKINRYFVFERRK